MPPIRWLALGVLSPSVLWVSVCWRSGELGAARPCDCVLCVLLCWRRGEEGGALLRLAGEDAKKRGLEASCDVLV